MDFYDVSMVDGSNVPMWINIAAGRTKDPVSASGCSPAGCTRPVPCPTELRVHAGGRTVGRLRVPLRGVRHRPVLLPWEVGSP
jgi:hypothetical protein